MAIFKRGKFFWYEFVFNGRRIQRSTKQGNRKAAIDIESAYRTALAKGEVGIEAPKKERRTIGELLDALKARYELDGKMSSQNRSLLARARRDFGTKLATDLTAEDVTKYVEGRVTKGAANATVNRVIEVLRRAYKLAALNAPAMAHLSENNARQGFFTAAEMDVVLANLPNDGLRDFVSFGYISGMRKGEIESLRWENVLDGEIVLRAEDAKNGEARTIPIEGDLEAIVKRRREARRIKTASGVTLAEFLFHRGDGAPIGEFRKSWKTACIAAGVGKMVCPKCDGEGPKKRCKQCKVAREYSGRIFHDLRRSAVRDMIRAGVPQKVAQDISGHKTASIFSRYNITDDRDMREALRNTLRYRQDQQKAVVSMNR